MFGRKTYSWHMSPLHRRPRLSIATHCCSGQRWRWPSVRLSTGALCFSLVPVDLLATGARRPSFYFTLATVNLLATDVPHHFCRCVQACPSSPVAVLATGARQSAVKGRCSQLLPLMIDRAPWRTLEQWMAVDHLEISQTMLCRDDSTDQRETKGQKAREK
ncbi:hypothetical protein PVAP13_5KG304921 [Panicum virgatum]|uniref:Uncharacterized protein n=1 Tax=Panicum virgatum TaxID=38727 RepID=A0A8T0SEL5_PANVG|nr:hypothetical protein PVAP13_5KG304921 [Panicum virgatum]